MIITSSNLDYLITPVRLLAGDLTGSTFSDSIILTALVAGVKYLQNRWNNRYLIYTSDMLVSGTTVNTPNGECTLSILPDENDVFRNCAFTFESESPPIIDQNDEYPILIAAVIFLRRSVMQSSITVFSNWSTPDLSYSNVQSAKVLQDLLKADMEALDTFFNKRLGRATKSSFPLGVEQDIVTHAPHSVIVPEIITVS